MVQRNYEVGPPHYLLQQDVKGSSPYPDEVIFSKGVADGCLRPGAGGYRDTVLSNLRLSKTLKNF